MKKIAILHGMESTFPQAFVERVNSMKIKGIVAEPVSIDYLEQAVPTDYAVIIDRISQDVPFYRAWLKNAALCGSAVINNPFWWSADEKFFNNCLAEKLGIPVPKTVLLPSHARPTDTTETSFRNMKMPLDWPRMFDRIGFPAYMKPHDGGGWKSVYKVNDPQDLWNKHAETDQLVMMLQEEIHFEDYYRCYCLGQKYVHIMPYEPRNPHHLRYATQPQMQGEAYKKMMKTITDYVLRLNKALGYDFNTVEFAVRDGIPYAIDFCNPAPDADVNSVGQENFEWIVENAAKFAVERAQAHQDDRMNLSWGSFVRTGAMNLPTASLAKEATEKSSTPKVKAEKAEKVEKAKKEKVKTEKKSKK